MMTALVPLVAPATLLPPSRARDLTRLHQQRRHLGQLQPPAEMLMLTQVPALLVQPMPL